MEKNDKRALLFLSPWLVLEMLFLLGFAWSWALTESGNKSMHQVEVITWGGTWLVMAVLPFVVLVYWLIFRHDIPKQEPSANKGLIALVGLSGIIVVESVTVFTLYYLFTTGIPDFPPQMKPFVWFWVFPVVLISLLSSSQRLKAEKNKKEG